jgi:hypothetical protein
MTSATSSAAKTTSHCMPDTFYSQIMHRVPTLTQCYKHVVHPSAPLSHIHRGAGQALRLIAERVPASTALGVHYTRSRELRDTQQRAGYQLTGDELEPQLRAALICADDAGDAGGVKRPWSSASLNQGNACTDWTPPPVGALSWANSPPVLPTQCCTPVCSSPAFEHQLPGAPLPQRRSALCSNNLIPPS